MLIFTYFQSFFMYCFALDETETFSISSESHYSVSNALEVDILIGNLSTR